MPQQYKNLQIDREKIIDTIKNFFDSKSELEAQVSDDFKEVSEIQKRCEVETNQGSFYLDVYFKKDGKTTLVNSGGDSKFLQLKEELCDYIVEYCTGNENKASIQNPWFTAKNFSRDDVDNVIDLIRESEFFSEELSCSKNATNKSVIWQFKGIQNEKLVITYFDTGTLLLQGKPELLFLESIETITQLFDTDEISTKLNESGFFESQIDDSIIQNDILQIVPNAFDKLPSEQLKKTVKQALIFKNFKSNFEDFTVYTFNAYRALEGHYRYLLNESGITYNGTAISIWKDSIDDGNDPRLLKDNYAELVTQKYGYKSEEFKKYLTDINRIINDERNKYFHWEKFEQGIPLDETALVEDEETARAIIVKCLTKIEEYYKVFY